MSKKFIIGLLILSVMTVFNMGYVYALELTGTIQEKSDILANNFDEIGNETDLENESDLEKDDNYTELNEVQKVKVITTKVDEDENPLEGAVLQIINKDGVVLDEWISDGTNHETLLEDGEYILHEVSAPEGYEIAEDQTFSIKVKVEDITTGVTHEEAPCPHNGGVPLYYVEIKGVKQETYCINQGWDEPAQYVYKRDEEGNIIYDEKGRPTFETETVYDESGKAIVRYITKEVNYNGEILNPDDIRNFTVQTVSTDDGVEEKIDVSDQSLTNQELYDKLLDIIYHRYKAKDDFKELSDAEIRFITEYALKNYSSAGVTTKELAKDENGKNIIYYDENGKKHYKYKYVHFLRDYKYNPEEKTGYVVDEGNGNAIGNLARHWYYYHKGKTFPKVYNDLFNYLIKEEDHHPDNMKLYIYSNFDEPIVPNAAERYQNLLGITGYFEDFDDMKKELKVVNKYSDETTKVEVTKIWDDCDYSYLRPSSITINLYANGNFYSKVELSENNNWKYTFENLLLYDKGNKIEYTITEDEVIDYYTEITGDMNEGFTIVNTHFGEGGSEDDSKEYLNPETVDNIDLYLFLFAINTIAFSIILIYEKVWKREDI